MHKAFGATLYKLKEIRTSRNCRHITKSFATCAIARTNNTKSEGAGDPKQLPRLTFCRAGAFLSLLASCAQLDLRETNLNLLVLLVVELAVAQLPIMHCLTSPLSQQQRKPLVPFRQSVFCVPSIDKIPVERSLLCAYRLDQRVYNPNCSVALSRCQIFGVEDRCA